MGLGQKDQIVWTTGMQACGIIDTKIMTYDIVLKETHISH